MIPSVAISPSRSAPPTVATASRRGVTLSSTPGWLRLVSIGVAILVLAGGIVGLATASARHNSAESAVRQAAPVVVNAQAIHTALSDADSTMAGGFLAGRVIPASAASRYQDDLARSSAGLTLVTAKGGGDPQLAMAAATLAVDTPIYAGIVQTAVANNRQGFPVAGAYLAEANNLMRSTMLPAAAALDARAQTQLSHDNDAARAPIALILVFVLMATALFGLAILQFRVARKFRRLLNLPLVLASVLVLAVGVWAVAATTSEHRSITTGQHQGIAPLTAFAQARTLAFQARGDDELTLVTRDAVPTYQQNYTSTLARLRAVIAVGQSDHWTPAQQSALRAANAALASYDAQHQKLRAADTSGNLTGAIQIDRTAAAAAADQLDQTLAGGITLAAASFESAASSAASDLAGVGWWWLALMVLCGLAVLIGVEPRIREYR